MGQKLENTSHHVCDVASEKTEKEEERGRYFKYELCVNNMLARVFQKSEIMNSYFMVRNYV